MSEMDDGILQDFLIEAGEILELLSEQLVDLEKSPEDNELLNAIFRGFHTVKGGAGFLSLTPLVETCHGAENVFDTLRNRGRPLTSELMDTILQALDTVNEQFSCLQQNQPLPHASPTLLNALTLYSSPLSASSPEAESPVSSDPKPPSGEMTSLSISSDGKDITDDEFEKLLDKLHGKGNKPHSSAPAHEQSEITSSSTSHQNDSITDLEFEQLLDQLHGEGKGPSVEAPSHQDPPHQEHPYQEHLSSVNEETDQTITDDDFEKLLDQLHGKGKSPSSSADIPSEQTPPNTSSDSSRSGESPFSAVSNYVSSNATTGPLVPETTQREEKKSSVVQNELTVRVNTSTLDTIMNMVGELVLVRNRLLSLGANYKDESLTQAVTNLDVVTADLQGEVMKTRMQPIKKVFGRFPRVVRDLARSLKKEIVLETRGEDTDLDKNLVEALADPMVHLVRNSVDHGIEYPDVRENNGKSRVGTITLVASQEGDHILLTIEDDGGGMDASKLRDIAVQRGLMDHDTASRLTDYEAFNLIFAPGFSTKSEISDISGRGVGMDVVKTAINQLNGTISIHSELGYGTIISIKVPLTLAILPTLMVGVGNSPFALPLSNVSEIITLDLNRTNTVDGQLTMMVREKAIPMFYLQEWLCRAPSYDKRKGHVVILQLGHQSIAFVVDFLIGQEEVVIKPLDDMLQGTPGMAGATITSDGQIALILDVPNLLKRYVRR